MDQSRKPKLVYATRLISIMFAAVFPVYFCEMKIEQARPEPMKHLLLVIKHVIKSNPRTNVYGWSDVEIYCQID